jgi:hypothetical protein
VISNSRMLQQQGVEAPILSFVDIVQPRGSLSYQIRGLQMQNLSGAALDGPAHLHHMAPLINASQKPALPQGVVQSLLAHGEALGARQGLGDLIAGHRVQE